MVGLPASEVDRVRESDFDVLDCIDVATNPNLLLELRGYGKCAGITIICVVSDATRRSIDDFPLLYCACQYSGAKYARGPADSVAPRIEFLNP